MTSENRLRHYALFIFIFTLISARTVIAAVQQHNAGEDLPGIEGFADGWHHWYDITDEERVITPIEGQERYKKSDIKGIADNILLYQKTNGGWPKNYDMLAILSDAQKTALEQARTDTSSTTFDNGATHYHVLYLARAYQKLKLKEYSDAALRGIEFILSAQYPNGGWPQFFPDTGGYRKHITFNDGAMIGVMKVLQRIAGNEQEFSFVNSSMRSRAAEAFERGLRCILRCQIVEGQKVSVWCQQHHVTTLLPVGARTFEPAAICNGESAAIVEFLMSIPRPNGEIIASVKNAVNWFKESAIRNTVVDTVPIPAVKFKYHTSRLDRVVREQKGAPPIWTRYYELGTHRPVFCNRDGKPVYSLAEVERERRTGYGWYVYTPAEVLEEYPKWLKRIGEEN